jgi:hypothetical protein
MVYDSARKQIFLFGGYFFDENFDLHYLNETWIFDRQNWTQQNPAHTPRGGDGVPWPIITYDAARKQPVVLDFGGGTWVWTENDWKQILGADRSPVTIEGGLGYDETSQRVLLWGHDIYRVHEFPPETWWFDGQAWTKSKEREHGPYSREATILYDSRRQKLLLFAYVSATNVPVQILEWSETGWENAAQP